MRYFLRPVPQHGTDNGYVNYRCRCRACVTEHSRVRAAYEQRQRHHKSV